MMVDEKSYYRPDLEEMCAFTQSEGTHSHASKLLQEIGVHFNIAKAVFSSDGICQFEINEQIVSLQYIPNQNVLVVKIDIIFVPPDADEDFYTNLLVANFNTAFEKTGALAVDSATNNVFLWQRLPLGELFTEELKQIIGKMVRTSLHWKKYLTNKLSTR